MGRSVRTRGRGESRCRPRGAVVNIAASAAAGAARGARTAAEA